MPLLWRQLTSLLGPQGANGPQGAAGTGLPTGGDPGQILRKRSNDDHDCEWSSQSAALTEPLFIQAEPPSPQQLAGAQRFLWWDTSGPQLTLYIEDGIDPNLPEEGNP